MTRIFFATSLILLVFGSCNESNKKQLKEGMIEYNINYLNEDQETLYSFLLPKTMTIKFKKNRMKSELKGFSGNFCFSIITNTETDSAIALFKIMNQNYYYIENEKGPSELFGNIPGMKINYTEKTCSVAGFNGEIANIESNIENFSAFDVVYTNKIKIRNPNKKNPFYEIKGVLLDFSVNMYNMDMRFVANRVIDSSIADNEFAIPENYQRIDKENVNQILSLLE